jgi:hypothetical protein
MSVWACSERYCKYCPYCPTLCSNFQQGKLNIICQACNDLRHKPNFVELIRLQNEIFPIILNVDVNKEETKINIKDIDTTEKTPEDIIKQLKERIDNLEKDNANLLNKLNKVKALQ